MRGATLPIAFLVLVGAVIGLLYLLRGSPEPDPVPIGPGADEETGRPAYLDEETWTDFVELRRRIRDGLGADADAFVALRRTMPEAATDRVSWLRLLRPEFNLAVRADDDAAGARAMMTVAGALKGEMEPVRSFVDGPAFRETWIRALESEVPATRVAAVRLVVTLGGEANRARVIHRLKDSDAGVRVTAVDAYVRLGGGPSRLAALYPGETEIRVRHALLMAFASSHAFRRPEVLAIEAEAMRSGSNVERIQAMENLGGYRDQDLVEAVLANLDSTERQVRKSALMTLARLKDRRALDGLRARAGKEKDDELRALTAKVIADLD